MAKLGILAGSGDLPRKLIQACSESGRAFHVIYVQNFGEKALPNSVALPPEKSGTIIKTFKDEGVEEIVLAGALARPRLFHLRPDLKGVQLLFQLGFLRSGDDSLLKTIACFLERHGFKVIGAQDILPELLMPEGVLTQTQPSKRHEKDIELGIKAAQDLGIRDIGQSVIVRGGKVIGYEDSLGTDALIQTSSGVGGVLIKMKKPQQDGRLDLPTIGPETLENAIRAGLEGVVLQAGGALLLEKEKTIAAANDAGAFIFGYNAEKA